MVPLIIPNNILEQMTKQAKAKVPIEACGILAGKNGEIQKIYEMTNADKSSDHFTMEPKEQFKVVKDIRSAGLEMLAIYHSHPETPARPSAEDIQLALTPNVIYVILSLHNKSRPAIKGFLIENYSVAEVPVRIVEEQK